MDSFWRSLRFVWPYRGKMALSLGFGLMVALLWGANISAVYPLLTVLLDKKTLVDWVNERIAREEQQIADLSAAPDAQSVVQQRAIASRHARLQWYVWIRPFVEQYTPRDNFQAFAGIMGFLVLGIALKGIFDFGQVYLASAAVQLTMFDLRNRMFRQAMKLDLGYFTDNGSHELMARFTNDLELLASGLRALLGKVLLEPLKALSCLTFACIFNWRLTLVTLLLFPSAALLMGLLGRMLKRVSRRNLESMSRIYKILQESFSGIRIVKAFNMERYERLRLFRETKRFFRQSMKLNRIDAAGEPIIELFAVITIAAALTIGSYLVMTGSTEIWGITLASDPLEPSMLFVFYGLIAGICDPFRKVFSVYGRVQRGVAASERIFQCLDQTPSVKQKPRARELPRHCQSIEFRDLTFGYSSDRVILRNINLKVRFGETIAIVGSTGCGKTSLVNLLPRFYDPLQGAVLIDGVDIRDVSFHSLRHQMGFVTQQVILFDDTIFNNIASGHPEVDPALVESAAKSAYAHRFITELPQGYATVIGEMGERVSGGQRQRISLARAILRDPAILILDEATSSLDVESEALIHKALRNFTRGRTTFVVTHRLSTLDIADRIVVVGTSGEIEAVGTHAELLAASPTYGRLHEVQAKGA